ncbi:hypothetical protein GCM10027613_41620 [Microlunatus endophyticus]
MLQNLIEKNAVIPAVLHRDVGQIADIGLVRLQQLEVSGLVRRMLEEAAIWRPSGTGVQDEHARLRGLGECPVVAGQILAGGISEPALLPFR